VALELFGMPLPLTVIVSVLYLRAGIQTCSDFGIHSYVGWVFESSAQTLNLSGDPLEVIFPASSAIKVSCTPGMLIPLTA